MGLHTETANSFLLSIGMHPDLTDIREVQAAIESAMSDGLCRDDGGLMMLPSYIKIDPRPLRGRAVAIDAGGTRLRCALVDFDNGGQISGRREIPMPGTQGAVTKDEFFAQVAGQILTLTRDCRNIGFCFSYPARILPNRDAVAGRLTKEVHIHGIEDSVLGDGLLAALRQSGMTQKPRFALVNDTVACLLGGLSRTMSQRFDGCAGLVCGTGLNACYYELGENIPKLGSAEDMIINLEAGGFCGIAQGSADPMLDATTNTPGSCILEKMVSGAYFAGVAGHTAALAAKAGLLTDIFLTAPANFTARKLDEFVRRGGGSLGEISPSVEDEAVISLILDCLYERGAKLICALVAAIISKSGGGQTPEAPFLLSTDGAMLYSSASLMPKLSAWIDSYITGTMGRYVRVTGLPDQNLVGAAAAALSGD